MIWFVDELFFVVLWWRMEPARGMDEAKKQRRAQPKRAGKDQKRQRELFFQKEDEQRS